MTFPTEDRTFKRECPFLICDEFYRYCLINTDRRTLHSKFRNSDCMRSGNSLESYFHLITFFHTDFRWLKKPIFALRVISFTGTFTTALLGGGVVGGVNLSGLFLVVFGISVGRVAF